MEDKLYKEYEDLIDKVNLHFIMDSHIPNLKAVIEGQPKLGDTSADALWNCHASFLYGYMAGKRDARKNRIKKENELDGSDQT